MKDPVVTHDGEVYERSADSAAGLETDETEKISTAGRTFTLVKQKMPAILAKTVSSESARLQDLQSAGMDVLSCQ